MWWKRSLNYLGGLMWPFLMLSEVLIQWQALLPKWVLTRITSDKLFWFFFSLSFVAVFRTLGLFYLFLLLELWFVLFVFTLGAVQYISRMLVGFY